MNPQGIITDFLTLPDYNTVKVKPQRKNLCPIYFATFIFPETVKHGLCLDSKLCWTLPYFDQTYRRCYMKLLLQIRNHVSHSFLKLKAYMGGVLN